MGAAKRRAAWLDEQIPRYLESVAGIACPACAAAGMEVVDLRTGIAPFAEPEMPPGPRYICGRCLTEW